MKKSTLALSIAAAIGSLGLAGAANASMAVNAGGTGHQLVFPYFSAQGDNATLLSITNTDTTNGKLVKVRFRGAANSDDLFDFTLALSPGDVWTAAVTKDAATGLAQLATTDKSCTLPASVNAKFSTFRLDPSASDADKAAGTREGYVEVITMGDIAKLTTTEATTVATALFTTIKHKAGVAPCAAAVMTEKLSTKAKGDAALAVPTGGISGDWIILNQTSTAAWSGSATALSPSAVGATVNKVFWPQISGTPEEALAAVTSDPLLVKEVVAIQNFDLPDMSTPYSSAAADAKTQADQTTAALAKTNIMNQYVTDDAIAAVTDLLFSQPTRRYHVAVNYTALADDVTTTPSELNNLAKTGTKAVAIFRDTTGTKQEGATAGDFVTGTFGSVYYRPTNMAFQTATSRTLCLNSISTPNKDNRFDREETTPATETTDFTISPVVVASAAKVFICGEAAVISINDGGVTAPSSALGATVARNDITFKEAAYTDGWMSFSTLAANGTAGLPILGQAFIRAANGAVNYGFGYAHKTK
jgi:hypothetical protein